MKMIQTDNRMEIKTSGLVQVLTSVAMMIVGVVIGVSIINSSERDGSPFMGIFCAVLFIAGLVFLFFARSSKTVIERGGETNIMAKKIIGGKTQEVSFPTSNIVSVRLTTSIETTRNSGVSSNSMDNTSRQTRSVLQLVLSNNDTVDLGSSANGSHLSMSGINLTGLITKAPLSKEAEKISQFLGVPLDAVDNSSLSGAISSIKSMYQQAKADTTEQKQTSPPQNMQGQESETAVEEQLAPPAESSPTSQDLSQLSQSESQPSLAQEAPVSSQEDITTNNN